jgi:hypothetical protein
VERRSRDRPHQPTRAGLADCSACDGLAGGRFVLAELADAALRVRGTPTLHQGSYRAAADTASLVPFAHSDSERRIRARSSVAVTWFGRRRKPDLYELSAQRFLRSFFN